MWFHESTRDAFDVGIGPALEATGYRALRIDLVEHNEMVDDRIIAEIRRSGLVVADFTGQRHGVYFEAGLAMGEGVPVIRSCHDADVPKLHFDTRQFNHVVWKEPRELREKLEARIRATMPVGEQRS